MRLNQVLNVDSAKRVGGLHHASRKSVLSEKKRHESQGRLLFVTFMFIVYFMVVAPHAFAASRYWVGGNASPNWNATGPTNWGSVSNTQDNASVPGASDDVFFDGVGTGASNSTLSASISIKSLDMTGYVNTLTHSNNVTLTIAGNGVTFKLVPGMTYTLGNTDASAVTFTGTSGTTLITTAGKTLGRITFNGSGGTFQLQDNATSSASSFNCTAGTFDPNGNRVTFSGASRTFTINGSCTFYDLTNIGYSSSNGQLVLAADQTVTHNLTLTGLNNVNKLLVRSDILGVPRTITNTGATMNWSNVDFKDIALNTPYDASAIIGGSGDAGGNSGITFTPAQTNYWVGNGASWGDASKWKLSDHVTSGRMPLPQDDVRFDASSFSSANQTITVNQPRLGRNIDWTGVTNSPTWAKTYVAQGITSENYGSITLVPGMNNTGVEVFTMAGRGDYTFTSAGQVWSNPLTIAMINGTTTLQDAFNSSATTTLTNGGFDAGTSDVTAPAFIITGTNARTLAMGSGTWTATSSSGTVWNATATTSLTILPESSTIVVFDAGSSAKTFVGGWMTYNNITFSGNNIAVTGSNTFNTFAVNTAGLATGLKLTSGTTQTVTAFSTNGFASNLAKLSSTASGVASISQSSGTVSVDYMSIASSTATGGATWYAGANSTNAGNNTGWLFSSPSSLPIVNTNTPTFVATSSIVWNGSIAVDGSASSTIRGFAWGTSSNLTTGTATTTEMGTFGVSSFSTTTIDLIPNTTYYFRAYAVNTSGTSTGAIVSTTTPPWSVPDAPTEVSATPGNQSVTITFTPGTTGGSPILYYHASSTPGNITATSSGSPIVVFGLANDTSYTFQVYAVNALGTSSPSTASVATTPSNLVLDMTFDGDTPSTVADASLYGNNGTLHDATATTSCISGSCYSFDGASNYISVPSSASLNPTGAITISAWVKPIGQGASTYLSVVKKTNSYDLEIRQDGTILMYLTGVNSWVTNEGSSNRNLFDGAWHNLVVTYDGTVQSIYIDNVFAASTTASGNIATTSNEVNIGKPGYGYYKGLIDDVRIYNNSLTAGDVETLYLSYGQLRTIPRTYYISSSVGSDSNDGLSEETPWKNIDMINKQKALPYGIIPGDQMLLKRGDTWEGEISLDRIGTTGSATTTIGAYGTVSDPKPIIYGDGRNSVWTAVVGHSGVYQADIGAGSSIYKLYQDNTAYTEVSDTDDLVPGTWVEPYGPIGTVWIYTSDGNQPSNIRIFRDTIIGITNSTNLVIENLNLEEAEHAIVVSNSHLVTLSNIYIKDTLNQAVLFSTVTNSIMDNITAENIGNSPLYIRHGSNNTIRNCTIDGVYKIISGIDQTSRTLDRAGIGLEVGVGDLIENNTVRNVNSSIVDYYFETDSIVRYNRGYNAKGMYPHGTNNIMYGNIMDGVGIYTPINTAGPGINYVLNNTFYNFTGYGLMASEGAVIRNNIMYVVSNNTEITNYDDTGIAVDSDYNCFYNASTTLRFEANGVIYSSLSAFQSATGHDLHSVYGDPLLHANYTLAADSPCKDMGANVSEFINFPYEDYAGVSIPQGSAPDAGALESVVVSTIPNAPTSVSATAGNAQASVGFTAPDSDGGSSILYYLASSTPGNKTATSTGSPIVVTGLSNGTTYTFQVYGVNAVGTSSASTASAPITLDGTAPTTVAHLPGGTYGAGQLVTLTCTDNVGGVGCDKTYYTTNGGTPDTDSSQFSTAISITTDTTLKFFSKDLNGNTEGVNTEIYTIDATYPFTTISTYPSTPTTSTSASFTFSANKTSTYECKLDSASFASCTSPQSLTGLADGSHTFTVRATDELSHVEPSPAFATWVVDTTAPSVSIASPSNGATVSGASVSFSATHSDAGSGVASVQFKVDGVNVGSSGSTNPYSITWDSTGASNASHTIDAVVRDAAENVATSTVTVVVNNTVAPATTYSIGGTLSGLTGTVVLKNNGGDNLVLTSNGAFTFATNLADGAAYNVTVYSQPSGQTCIISSGSGTVNEADITNISVTCTTNSVTAQSTPRVSYSSSSSGSRASLATLMALGLTPAVPGCPTGYICNPIALATPTATTTATPSGQSFTRALKAGQTSADVKNLQIFLNAQGFAVAKTGPGSTGHETTYFGPATKAALMKFQLAHKKETLDPQGLPGPTGFFGRDTMKAVNAMMK